MNSNMQSLTMNDGTVLEFDIRIDPDDVICGNEDDTEMLSLFDYKTRISL